MSTIMVPIAILRFGATGALWISLAIVCLLIVIGVARRVNLPITTQLLMAIGASALALACGTPEYLGHRDPTIAVMIDRSASTRGAAYRDRSALEQRLRELLGQRAYSIVEMPEAADETKFQPPANADAIVLFSDAQFDLPATAPPTFVIVDPALETAHDAAITRLSIDADGVRVGVRNSDNRSPRRLVVEGLRPSPAMPIGETLGVGSFLFRASRDPAGARVSARITGSDLWPENDAMGAVAPSTVLVERWWISDDRVPPDASWRLLRPRELPTDAGAYLVPSVIAIDNQPADAIDPRAMFRLSQYVRDLGGALIIVGGDRAFGAGSYFHTPLDAISPLASAPPAPTRHWIVLIDSSGSMAAGNKWPSALQSVQRAIASLPQSDLITVGSFARDVRWWIVSSSVEDARKQTMPPGDISPNGPTNLEPALEDVITKAGNARTPLELLILSDAETKIDDVPAVSDRLRAASIRVNLLATGADLAGDNPVAELVRRTDGQLFRESDPSQWASRVNELLRATMPELVRREPATVKFDESLGLDDARVSLWNRTWLKSNAAPLARIGDEVAGARWNVGLGRAAALAFPADARAIGTLALQIEAPPRDPRFSVRREEVHQVRIAVDAADKGDYLNGLSLRLMVRDESSGTSESFAFMQIAPGRYEASLPAPRASRIATITLDDTRVIDRFAVAGRYAREFDAIGNNRERMQELARLTNGRVIEPTETLPLEMTGPVRRIPLTSSLAFIGASLIALGLIHWRRLA